ncbi:hypothetical protein SASPL_151848 [Salvia splendens]|uniref:Cupin type-1 domain-containing protein n=1 Tax=Salvia splendens TaxID=180675 RepID=A0A8X8W2G1_SALSN|nr:hypothetical protein SASPL_151848 [Salvia splendens]
MEFNLQPQKADATVVEGEGGSYYAWASITPDVVGAEIGAGIFVLHPQGFALPHYGDTRKIGYVIEGTCTMGIISPNNKEEKIIVINKGDAVPVESGAISWWFNGGDSDVSVIFLGESSESYTPGQFDYYFLTGALALLRGFSTEFISKMYDLNANQSKELLEKQTNTLVIKIDKGIEMPKISNCKREEYVINLDEDSPLVDRIGLSPKLVRLEPESALDAHYSTAHQVIYVVKGGGKVQIVGLNGARMVDEVVEEGQLIVVPKFFVVAMIASHQGLELFSVSTSPRSRFEEFIFFRNGSAYKSLSSSILEMALNVPAELVESLKKTQI